MKIIICEKEMRTLGKTILEMNTDIIREGLGQGEDYIEKRINHLLNTRIEYSETHKTWKITKYESYGVIYYSYIYDAEFVCDIVNTSMDIVKPLLPIIGGLVRSLKLYSAQIKGIIDSFKRRNNL